MNLTIAVTQLFETETQRRLIDCAIAEFDRNRWYRTGELAEAIDKSRNSVTSVVHSSRGTVRPLVRFGIFEPKHEITQEPNIPHYRIADSEVVELLDSWDGYPLTDLFQYSGAQDLVSFFVLEGPDTEWSYNQIQQNSPIGYQACSKHMETLVDAGLVTEHETPRGSKYQLDTDSKLYGFLGQLNNAIMSYAEQYNDLGA